MTGIRRFAAVLFLGGAVLLGAGGCGGRDADPGIDAVVDRHAEELVALDGVSAVGVGIQVTGRPCVRIYVIELTAELRTLLPSDLEGHPVEIVVAGDFVPVAQEDES